jgi:hypothetical protein
MVAESIPLGYRKRAKRMVRGALDSISAVRPRHWDAWRLIRAQAGGTSIRPAAWCDERFGRYTPAVDPEPRRYDIPRVAMDNTGADGDFCW